jgi:hypothetical protein
MFFLTGLWIKWAIFCFFKRRKESRKWSRIGGGRLKVPLGKEGPLYNITQSSKTGSKEKIVENAIIFNEKCIARV